MADNSLIDAMSKALHVRSVGDASCGRHEVYDRASDLAQRYNRSRSHRHFLRNIYRFPPRIVYQQFSVYLRNRLVELGIIRMPDSMAGC